MRNPNPDTDLTLQSHVDAVGVKQASLDLGVTHGAINQMIRAERQIYVKRYKGAWHYGEIKHYRRSPRKAA